MQPLKGITVVTLEHAIAAPFATRQLADLGARVIKIERPGSGDFARSYDQRVRGLASHFVWTNRSKQSLTLDVKHAAADAVLDALGMFVQPGRSDSLHLDDVSKTYGLAGECFSVAMEKVFAASHTALHLRSREILAIRLDHENKIMGEWAFVGRG